MLGTLPLHPMMVHFAVVFLLATAVMQLAAIVAPRVRDWLGWVLPAAGIVTAIVARIAESLGEVLVEVKGETPSIHEHAERGELASLGGIVLGVCTIAFWLSTSPRTRRWVERRVPVLHRRPVVVLVSVLTAAVCVFVVVITTLAGHSGAVSVWTK